MMAMMMAKLFLFATVLSNAPAARDRFSLCVSRSVLDRLTLCRPLHHRMLELDRLTLDLTLHILELVPHLQIPAPEQKVTATRKPSVVDTRRCCSHQPLFALLLLLLLHLRANQEPPAASSLFGPRPLPVGICESKDPFRFFSASGPHCRLLSPHLSQVQTTPGQASNLGPKRAC